MTSLRLVIWCSVRQRIALNILLNKIVDVIQLKRIEIQNYGDVEFNAFVILVIGNRFQR